MPGQHRDIVEHRQGDRGAPLDRVAADHHAHVNGALANAAHDIPGRALLQVDGDIGVIGEIAHQPALGRLECAEACDIHAHACPVSLFTVVEFGLEHFELAQDLAGMDQQPLTCQVSGKSIVGTGDLEPPASILPVTAGRAKPALVLPA
ncbi:hypothetical protein WR25_07240 [Diploscapter pachys]|uniref:Uncharacterized protein n=1 Tax=Diploscapter pachys TaxID=2018661 RepID=A0A2A2K5Z3_9BILA|nr:hypothetical protein WR25_07240 [Diploscapter pachys]